MHQCNIQHVVAGLLEVCVQLIDWVVDVCPAGFPVVATDGKLIDTSDSRGDRVLIDVEWDTAWWVK